MRALVLGWVLVPGIALACPMGSDSHCPMGCKDHEQTAAAVAPPADPSACAHKAELVGGSCSYTTSMMAQRVLSEGNAWSFTGTLASAATALQSHVAAPYSAGPQGVRVVANEVLEAMTTSLPTLGRVELDGKLLEVDGVKYFVLTSYRAVAES